MNPLRRRRGMTGNKVRRTITLRPDLDEWVAQMQARAGGWTCTGVIEYCIERAMEIEGGDRRVDRVLDTLARVEEGVTRLRNFHDYELWERFEDGLEGKTQQELYDQWLTLMDERASQ